jgi:hypothetical protein
MKGENQMRQIKKEDQNAGRMADETLERNLDTLKVKYVGFGGILGVPCYEDEDGRLYFDENNGNGTLCLYTGAYRHPQDHDICGEPDELVTKPIECEEPYVQNPRKLDYQLLARLKADCEYFIRRKGRCRTTSLWADIDTIIAKMEDIYASFPEEDRPLWLTPEAFEKLKKQVKIKVTVSVKALYEADADLRGLTIETEKNDQGIGYWDLWSAANVVCMDGETCYIMGVDENTVTLKNEDGEMDQIFQLPMEAFQIGCTYCPA